jgi:hypothetical protein
LSKIGILNRKDDIVEGGKRAIARKWKGWGAIVTNSQLLFYRDAAQVMNIQATIRGIGRPSPAANRINETRRALVSEEHSQRMDKSYSKVFLRSVRVSLSALKGDHRGNMRFRFVMADGRQSLFQAESEEDKYEWMACINYGSSFKTADVRIRAAGMAKKDIELTGIAAAASHIRDLEMKGNGIPAPQNMGQERYPKTIPCGVIEPSGFPAVFRQLRNRTDVTAFR